MKNNQGFTLVEILIYSLLLGMIVTGFVSFALAISRVNNKNLSIIAVNSGARSVITEMNRSIRQADAVTVPAKGNSGSNLALSLPNGEQVNYYSDNGILYRQNNGGSPLAVIDNRTSLDNISFYNLSGPGEADNIKVEFTLHSTPGAGPEFNYQKSFQTAIGLKR